MRSHGEKEEYEAAVLGHNYRMPEIEAAIGIEQLKKLPGFLKKRRRNAAALTKNLKDLEQLALPVEPEGSQSSWYLYTVRIRKGDVKSRDQVIEGLRKRGVGAAVYYHTPIHLMPYYRQYQMGSLPETERAAQQVFSLPVHPGLKPAEVNYVAKAVRQVFKSLF